MSLVIVADDSQSESSTAGVDQSDNDNLEVVQSDHGDESQSDQSESDNSHSRQSGRENQSSRQSEPGISLSSQSNTDNRHSSQSETDIPLSTPSTRILASGSRDFFIKDIWVVAMGDSFASGQGNPDAPSKLMGIVEAQWISNDCYRSAYGSWAFRTYKYIELTYRHHGILFTYLACSGATIQNGILGSGGQLDTVAEIGASANRLLCSCEHCCRKPIAPDVVLMSIGGNDIFYSDIVSSILTGNTDRMFKQLPYRFSSLKSGMEKMGREITGKLPGMNPKSVFYPHYFDISRNENGEIDASCSDLQFGSHEKFSRAADEVLGKINTLISQTSKKRNWTVVDGISSIFRKHGICSKMSYIRTTQQSYRLQGNCFGAFHPNRAGHSKVAQKVWSEVRNFLMTHLRL